jgi:glucose/arabinose dehydrogenase
MIRPISTALVLATLASCAGQLGAPEEVGATSEADTFGTCALPALAHQRVFPSLSFRQPVQLLQPPGDRSRWFVVEHGGAIKVFANDPAASTSSVFLDLSPRTKLIYESGMNGLAFDPGFASNGQVYVTYNAVPTHDAQLKGVHIFSEWRLSRFTSRDGGRTVDPSSEEILIDLDKFADEHNAGKLAFGSDGLLYVSVGDGGPSFDPNHFGQNLNVLFGKFLRLDVHTRTAGKPYSIPPANPFAKSGGRPEIYAYGLRNPWRWSFDRATGELWAGDVGQDAFEEVDKIVAGGNYGWSLKEAAHCYPIGTPRCTVPSVIDPVLELPHPDWRAVIGGFVYRGKAIPALVGTYVFGDFVSGRVSGLLIDPKTKKAKAQLLDASGKSISAFAEDADGELFFLDNSFGAIYKLASGTCQPTDPTAAPPYKFLMRAGTGTAADTNAYYASIGAPAGLTLDQWKAQRFGSAALKTAFYRNTMDLGFWREMSCTATLGRGQGGCAVRNWKNPDDPQKGVANLGTVTMDLSPEGFTRFYVFGPTGVLQPFAILDSEGKKFAPQVCNTCHGGHYQGAGGSADVGAVFREFEPSLFERRPGITQAQAEREWFDLNQAIRSANTAIHSEAEGAPSGTDHAKRGVLGYLDALYTQTSPPVSRDVHDPAHLPASWQHGGNPSLDGTMQALFERAINPYCMGCHRQNAIDLANYDVFQSLAADQGGRPVLLHYIQPDPSLTALQMPQAELMFKNLQADPAALAAVDDWLVAAQNPAAPQCRVDFEIDHGDFTFFGQDLWIVGDAPQLGAWSPPLGLRLDGSAFPTWRGSIVLPQGLPLQWKAVAINSADGGVIWETGNNHVFSVPNALHARQQFDWRR